MASGQTKKFIKKKDNKLVIGEENTSVGIPGGVSAQGNLSVRSPYVAPDRSDPSVYLALHATSTRFLWKKEKVQTLLSRDAPVGLDYVFVNTTYGFQIGDKIILNPFGPTRETGVVAYNKQETRIHLDDAINYPHYMGETIVKI